MLKFFSQGSAVLAGVVVVAGAAVLPLTAISQSTPPLVSDSPSSDSPRLLVIQGQVRSLQGNIVTVKTPDLPIYCPPGRVCPAVIVAGPTFNVEVSRASFQSASGSRLTPKPKLTVGESVVVVGRLSTSPPTLPPFPGVSPKSLTAQIVSKAFPSPVPLPRPVP